VFSWLELKEVAQLPKLVAAEEDVEKLTILGLTAGPW
jgi:hypothetical protein